MSTVKESWKKVGNDFGDLGKDIGNTGIGKDLGKIGKDLGKSIVKTVKHGAKAVSNWAEKDDPEPVDTQPAEEGEVIDGDGQES